MSFSTFLILLVIAAIVTCILLASTYNKLRSASETVKQHASNVEAAISKKLNLVNQLIDVVKSYQQGEQLVHLKVSSDSAANMSATYQQSGAMLATVQSIAERFPELKSGEQYRRLIDSIQACENEILWWRQKYNDIVKQYNSVRGAIPTVFIAAPLGFPTAPYLEFQHDGSQDYKQMRRFETDDGQRLEQLFVHGTKQLAGASRAVVAQAGQVADRLLGSSSEPAPSPALASGALPSQATIAAPISPAPTNAPPGLTPAAARGGGTQVFQAFPSLSIRFVSGPLSGTVVPVADSVVLGREPARAQVIVPDPQVSSAHAWIGTRDGRVLFVDRGSTNGSAINDQRVAAGQEVALNHHDTVTLGQSGSVRFRVELS